MMQVAVIGAGYRLPHLIRNLVQGPDTRVASVRDLDPHPLAPLHRRYPPLTPTDENGIGKQA